MNYQIAKELFANAEQEFSKAQEELARPSSDVVNYAVCLSARSALHHYLNCLYTLYTYENNDTREENLTVKELADRCRKYDDKVKEIDFSCMHCQNKDVLSDAEIFFCEDVNQVMACNNVAKQIRELIADKVKNSENQTWFFDTTHSS